MKQLNTILASLLISTTYMSSEVYAENVDDLLSGSSINNTVSVQTTQSELSSSLAEEQIRNIVRDEIKNNPELIIETLQEFERKMQSELEAQRVNQDIENITKYSNEIYSNDNTPIFGNENGGIIVVEFFDYNCKFCQQVAPIFEEVIEKYNVRRIYKEFPILSLESVEVASISQVIMSKHPEVYEEFHSAVYDIDGVKNKDGALKIVEELGLDRDEIEILSSSEDNMQILMSNGELAQNLNLTGTPVFIIGNSILRGAPSLQNFEDLLGK